MRTKRKFQRFWTTSVQHQVDHLEGKLFVDRLLRTERKMKLGRYAKIRKRR